VQIVGLTGGIGSGKSALADELSALGVPVIDADAVARRCVEPGSDGLADIAARFGHEILRPDGALDRAALAAIVFADATARHDLEAITHPCIRAGIQAGIEALRREPVPPALVVVEHPLLVESGGRGWLDRVVVVEAPLDQRIHRLIAERGMTEGDARARIAAQADDADRRAIADHVVLNDGDLGALRREASRILALLATEQQDPA
jgi:dephospho-CoA kinase